jgi:hypothetical protein
MEKLEGRGPLDSHNIRERIIVKRVFNKREAGMDWTDVVQDRDRWWALVNAVMYLRIP